MSSIKTEIINDTCPCCLDDIKGIKPFIKLNCNHSLCLECYNDYMIQKLKDSYNDEKHFIKKLICPYCRQRIIKKSEEELKREFVKRMFEMSNDDFITYYCRYKNGNIELQDYEIEQLEELFIMRRRSHLIDYKHSKEDENMDDLFGMVDILNNYEENDYCLWDFTREHIEDKIAILEKIILKKLDEEKRRLNANNNNINEVSSVVRPRRRARGNGRFTSRDAIMRALEEINNASRVRNNDENGFWAYNPNRIMNKIIELNIGNYSIETIKQKLRELFREQRICRQRNGRSYNYSLRSNHYDNNN